MDMYIRLIQNFCFLREHGFNQSQCNLHGLLHHIPQLTGNLNFPFPFCSGCFDKQDFSARTGPCQSGHDTRLRFLHPYIMVDLLASQKFFQSFHTYGNALLFPFYQFHSCLTAQCLHLFFQSTDTGFHRILIDNLPHGIIRHLQVLLLQPHDRHSIWQQIFLRNLEFFHCRVSRK